MNGRVAMLVSNACAPDRRVLRQARALANEGLEVTVLAWDRNGEHPTVDTDRGVRIERIHVPSSYGSGLQRFGKWPQFAQQALRKLQKHPYRALHCHDLDTLPIGYAHTRRHRIPLIFDAHESYPDFVAPRFPGWAVWATKLIERSLIKRVDALITVGDLLAEHYRKWQTRVLVVRNCSEYQPSPQTNSRLRAKWGLDQMQLVLCYVGGFTAGRVILPLLEAVCQEPSTGLVLVGRGSQKDPILSLANRSNRIVYLGQQVPPEEIVPIMQASDVVYYGLRDDYPNNQFSSPNALYSALAAGRPILTTNVGEISHIVHEEQCGIILSSPTVQEIRPAIARLRQPAARQAMADNARRAAETRYNWDNAKQTLITLYKDIWEER